MDGLKTAVDQLERQKAAIEKALAVLREIAGPATPPTKRAYKTPPQTKSASSGPVSAKRTISEEGRKAIGDAARKRWAARRAAAKATKK
jgi:hypothetical protein